MTSVNEQRVRQRISYVYDTAHGAQGDNKTIEAHVKGLRKQVGLEKEGAGDASDFLKDFGKGI